MAGARPHGRRTGGCGPSPCADDTPSLLLSDDEIVTPPGLQVRSVVDVA